MKEFILKRPLCFICLLFTGIIYFLLSKEGLPEPELPIIEGKETCIIGRIEDKEIKNNSQVLYLKQVSFPDLEEIQSELIQNQTEDSDIGKKDLEKYDSEKNNLEKNDSEKNSFKTYPIGLICYLEDSEDINSYPIGTQVKITGKVQFFSKATNPGEFDLWRYYRIQGYYFKLKNGKVMGQSEDYQVWKNGLWELKKKFGQIYETILNSSDASVLKAMVLGDKTTLDSEIKTLYQKSGIAHILAISGLHISILGMGLYRLLKLCRIPRPAAAGITMFLLLNYAVMTGGGTSTIRAVVMFVYSIGAELLHRTNDPPTSLALSAFIVTLVSPYYLFASGFWLSYMSVAGITIFVPAFLWRESRGHKSKLQKFGSKLLDSLLSGVGLSYFTFPVILYHFYEYPLYSILLNLFVVPLMTVLILFAIGALLLGGIWTNSGIVLAYPCHYILLFYEWLCEKVQGLPNSSLILGRPDMWKIIVFYMITGSMIAVVCRMKKGKGLGKEKLLPKVLKRRLSKGKLLLGIKIVVMVFAILLISIKLPSDTSITLLDVGQGDGICIQDSYGGVYMIDGGSSSKSNLAKYQLLPFLKYHGISKIDYWILTHGDRDHISGMIEILKMEEDSGLQIGMILIPDAKTKEEQWMEIKKLAEMKSIPLVPIHKGQTIQNQNFEIICLSPEKDYYSEEKNETSIICEIKYQDVSMLCTGDATLRNEERLMEMDKEGQRNRENQVHKESQSNRENQVYKEMLMGERNLVDEIRILKAAHHGSNTSSGEAFLDWYEPQITLISCGRNNRYGHPHEEVLKRLEENGVEVYRTDELGAIEVNIRGDGTEINVYGGK